MTYLNVCPVWPCGFCVLIVGWATPVLGGQYVSVVWPLTSGPASGVLCYNEDLSRRKPHLLIMGYKRGVVGLHATLLRYLTWLGVVSFPATFTSVNNLKFVSVPTALCQSFYCVMLLPVGHGIVGQ